MNLPWTAEQRGWLRALGHPVLVPREPDGAGDVEGAVGMAATPVDTPPAPDARAAPVDRGPMLGIPRPRPMRPVVVAPAALETPATPAPVPGRLDLSDPLHRALLRATSQRTPREGQALLDALAFDLAALREDSHAKRALWQGLRAARKASRG